jgi:hypothetical protein
LSAPIDFGVSFGNLDGAIAEWRSYQTSLESVINTSAELGTAQQNLGRTMQQSQQSWTDLDSTIQGLRATMQSQRQEIEQLMQAEQQQISILDGAGTSAESAAQGMDAYTGSLSNLGQELDSGSQSLNEFNTLQENLAGNTQTTFEKIEQLGEGFGQAAGAITGLIFSAHSLNRAQLTLNKTETQLEQARNKLEDQTQRLSTATEKYGADSDQVAGILADMAIQNDKIANAEDRLQLVHESFDLQLVTFATTTGPLVISTFSSITQGITSMGDVLGKSPAQIRDFIGAWGPWMAAGAGIAIVAFDIIDAMADIQKANDDLEAAIASQDWAAALKAKLEGLQRVTKDPLMIAAQSLETLAGKHGNKSGLDVLNIEKAEEDTIIRIQGWQEKIKSAMQEPSWSEALRLPPSLTTGLQSDLDRIDEIIIGTAKNIALGIQLDPTYKEQLFTELDTLFADIGTKVQELQKEGQRILISGTTEERAAWMGLPTNAEWQQAQDDYKGHLENAFVLVNDFNAKRLEDNTLTWDRYISTVDNASEEEINIAKETVGKILTGEKEKATGITEFNDVINESNINSHSIQSDLINDTIGLIKEQISWSDNYAETLQNQVNVLQTNNRAGISYNQTLLEQATQLGATNDQLNQYTLVGTESATTIEKMNNGLLALNLQLAQNKNALDLTANSYQFHNQGLVDGTIQAGKFLTGLIQNKAQAEAFRQELARLNPELGNIQQQYSLTNDEIMKYATLQNQGGDAAGFLADIIEKRLVPALAVALPAGIVVTEDEIKALNDEFTKTGSTAVTMNEIMNNAFAEARAGVTELVSAAVQGGDQWKDAWKDANKDFIPKGERGEVKDFIDDMADLEIAASDAATQMGIFQEMMSLGMIDEKEMGKWSNDIAEGLRKIRREASDIIGDDLAHNLVDPFITLREDGLSEADVNAITAFESKFAELSKGGITAEELRILQDSAAAILEAAQNAERLSSFQSSGQFDTGNDIDEINRLQNGEDATPAIIPAPVKDENFDTVLADAAADVDTLGRGGGEDGEASFTASTIPAPDATDFTEAMNTLLLVPADFVNRFNSAMSGGGGDEEDKGSSGLIIPAPAAEEFANGLNEGIDLANQFVSDFTEGMTDITNSAQDAIDNIVDNMQDLQASVEDSIDVIDELQNGLDNLKSKNITVHVGLSGPGVKFLATGYHGVVDKPTLMIVGEAGPERVDVSPSGGAPVTGLQMDRNVNINPVFSQSAKDLMGKDNNIMSSIRQARSGSSEREIVRSIIRQVTIDNKLYLDGKPILQYIKEHLLD